MVDLSFVTADVFTSKRFGGNPLAVFPNCVPLDTDRMQAIAREFNLSETVFAFPARARNATRQLRIFTPERELPFAGHPTVGTAIVLAEQGYLGDIGAHADIAFEEGAGLVPVRLERRSGNWSAALSAPIIPKIIPCQLNPLALAHAVGLTLADLSTQAAPTIASAGVPFLFLPVRNRDALSRARPDIGRWSEYLGGLPTQEILLFTLYDWRAGREVHARMFAPSLGVVEDPATGGAAAAAGRTLFDLQKPDGATTAWIIWQGADMGRLSRIDLTIHVEKGELARVEVGGEAVLISEGRYFHP